MFALAPLNLKASADEAPEASIAQYDDFLQDYSGLSADASNLRGNGYRPLAEDIIMLPHYSDLTEFLPKTDLERIAQNMKSNQAPSGPCYLEFHITNRCNSVCYFCNQRFLRKDNLELSLSQLKRILADCHRRGLKMVRLSGGGEPTVHPRILEILALLQKYEIRITRFDTNGILLNKKLSQKLVEHRLGILHLSLQAPTPDSWSKVTGLPANVFDKVMKNLAEFLEIDVNRDTQVYASIALDETTVRLVDEALELGDHFGIGISLHTINSHKYSERFHRNLKNVLKETQKKSGDPRSDALMANLLMAQAETNVACLVNPSPPKTFSNVWPICSAPWVGALVKPNGDLYQCCAYQVLVLGNLLRESMEKNWRNSNFERLRAEMHGIFLRKGEEETAEGLALQILPEVCFQNCPVRTSMFRHPHFDPL